MFHYRTKSLLNGYQIINLWTFPPPEGCSYFWFVFLSFLLLACLVVVRIKVTDGPDTVLDRKSAGFCLTL